CLLWAAHGKTAWETSQILQISQTTVSYHLENAKKKLGARTVAQAVARAVCEKTIVL
ncbi:MAG: helix-turn-helix transcriptional regulator, partial [Rhodospirillales bacterium]|nr:helix-turn-helix transcriptional regulator [Rhodospirillales bacterium]